MPDGSPLLLHDEVRPDLAARVETKYSFDRQDVGTLRQLMRSIGRPIHHAGKHREAVSTVRSIYFDDARFGACRANLDGLGVRQKIRLRWYDLEAPTGPCFLEIKWRRHGTTGKHRWRIDSGDRLLQMPLTAVPECLARLLPDRFAPAMAQAMQAVALVEYRREHFAVEDARCTLDYDLRFYPLLGRSRLHARFADRLAGQSLIECKTAVGSSSPLRAVMRASRARPARFSKYVTACQRLGYVTSQ